MKSYRLSQVDTIVLLAVSLVGFSLIATSVHRSVEASRSIHCDENLRVIGLGFHNYHAAYNRLPMGCGGTSSGSEAEPMRGNASRLSALVGLLPFVEQQTLWEEVASPLISNGQTIPAMGPGPWVNPQLYPPWGKRPEIYFCAADPSSSKFPVAGSYLLCYGDSVEGATKPDNQNPVDARAFQRGIFMFGKANGFRDVIDGTSNTIFLAEGKIGGVRTAKDVRGLIGEPSRCLTAHTLAETSHWPEGRGAAWADGALLSSGFQTILPPNSKSCTSENGLLEGVVTASSHHRGGAHVLFADGRVMFATDTIDAGDPSIPSTGSITSSQKTTPPGSQSPYGLWGALGTHASREIVANPKGLLRPQRLPTAAELKSFESLPLETWRAAGGAGSVRARQIGISPEGMLSLLTEQNVLREIGLSQLESEDAYRAVENSMKFAKTQTDALRNELKAALAGLEAIESEQLTKQGLDKSDAESLSADMLRSLEKAVDSLRKQRMMLIADALRQIDSADERMLKAVESGEIVFRPSNGMGTMKLQLVSGKWRVVSM